MLQEIIVALIVLTAFAWAAWYWMPIAGRRALARTVARGSRAVGLRDGGARRIEKALGDAPGCASCDSCGSCASPGKTRQRGAAEPEQTVRVHARPLVRER